ncbi:MAG: PPOX class F420-dependent oxidoreductase [Salinirussus sp.]
MPLSDELAHWFEQELFAAFATKSPDGSINLTPVWVDHDGEHLLVNTLRGRRKERNVKRDPAVALMLLDPDDPYRYVTVQGEVVELTEEHAADHYRDLAMRYTGEEDRYERRYGDEERSRVILKIEPQRSAQVAIEG